MKLISFEASYNMVRNRGAFIKGIKVCVSLICKLYKPYSFSLAYTLQESDRALSQLSNGGLGLKIGQFLAELWPFL